MKLELTLAALALAILFWVAHDINRDCQQDIACRVSEESPG